MAKRLFPNVPEGMGGKREGAGRPPNWFVDKCRDHCYTIDVPAFWAEVASGKHKEAKFSDRMQASLWLKEHGEGKAIQPTVNSNYDESKRPEPKSIEDSIQRTQLAIERIEAIIGNSEIGDSVGQVQ